MLLLIIFAVVAERKKKIIKALSSQWFSLSLARFKSVQVRRQHLFRYVLDVTKFTNKRVPRKKYLEEI